MQSGQHETKKNTFTKIVWLLHCGHHCHIVTSRYLHGTQKKVSPYKDVKQKERSLEINIMTSSSAHSYHFWWLWNITLHNQHLSLFQCVCCCKVRTAEKCIYDKCQKINCALEFLLSNTWNVHKIASEIWCNSCTDNVADCKHLTQ